MLVCGKRKRPVTDPFGSAEHGGNPREPKGNEWLLVPCGNVTNVYLFFDMDLKRCNINCIVNKTNQIMD